MKTLKKGHFLLISLIFSLILLNFNSNQITALEPTGFFDSAFDEQMLVLMEEAKVKSCSFSIVNNTELFYSKGYGEQPDVDTIYRIYSLSKLFITTATLKLYEQGQLDIDEDINNYLPFNVTHPDHPETPITLKHLLAHQSGMQETIPDYLTYICNKSDFPEIIYEYLNETNTFHNLTWGSEPGGDLYYSNLGLDLVAYIIEQIIGDEYYDYLFNNILTPLGMSDTKLNHSEYDESRLAFPYEWNLTEGFVQYPHFILDGRGCAGLLSSAPDLVPFLIIHMNNGNYNGINILNETSIGIIQQDYVDYWGLNWHSNWRNKGYQGFGGRFVGFRSLFLRRGHVGVILLTNQGHLSSSLIEKTDVDLFDYIMNTAEEALLNPKTTETHFSIVTSLLFVTLLGLVSLVYHKNSRGTSSRGTSKKWKFLRKREGILNYEV